MLTCALASHFYLGIYINLCKIQVSDHISDFLHQLRINLIVPGCTDSASFSVMVLPHHCHTFTLISTCRMHATVFLHRGIFGGFDWQQRKIIRAKMTRIVGNFFFFSFLYFYFFLNLFCSLLFHLLKHKGNSR